MMCYPTAARIPLSELEKSSMPPEYVAQETKRCIAGVGGKAKVYPGIGFDVPLGNVPHPADPKLVYQSTISALKAGADGVVASRNYDEMQTQSIEAFGRACEGLYKY